MSEGREINLATLPLPQMQQLQQQFQQEIEYLTQSFRQLKKAEAKFGGAQKSIASCKTSEVGHEVLVPLSSAVYVKGSLDAPQTFLVDIGTGYFVEKNAEDADNYYKRKEESVQASSKNVEGIIVEKQKNLQVVTDVLRQRMAMQQQMQQQQAAAAK